MKQKILGLYPMPDASTFAGHLHALAKKLHEHNYDAAVSLPLPGTFRHVFNEPRNLFQYVRGGRNAHETSFLAPVYYKQFARQHSDAFTLYRAFGINEPVQPDELRRLIGGQLFDGLLRSEMLIADGDLIQSRVVATPYNSGIYFNDLLSAIKETEKSQYVFLGRCSMRLADFVTEELGKRRFERGLDLCSGSGVQALNSAQYCDTVLGGEINPRAIAYATANAIANDRSNARFVQSSVFANIEGRFDLITSNPPFLILDKGSRALDGYGGEYGMEIELRIFEGFEEHLNPGGVALIVASSAVVGKRDLLEEKLGEIFGRGGYRVDIHPINEYYSTHHYHVYEPLGVDRCTLNVVRVERVGTQFELTTHNWAPWTQAAYRANTAISRWRARRYAEKKSKSNPSGMSSSVGG